MRITWMAGVSVLGASYIAMTPALAEYKLYEQRDTKLSLTADVIAAGFANSDPWFGEAKDFVGGDVDSWMEFGAEPGLNLETQLANGVLYGKLSVACTTTSGDDASGLTIGESDKNDCTTEQANVGFRFADTFTGLEESEFSISGGRQDYSVGTGLLINDGSGDGGHRGGWYIGMRKAFRNTVIARVKSKALNAEVFHLANDPRRGGINGEADGVNGDYHVGDLATIGAMYMSVDSNVTGFSDLDVYDGRLEVKPFSGWTFSGEFAHETSDEIEADGWYAQGTFEPEGMTWSPAFTYRYAHFDGDDPSTSKDERFREIAYGYTDYGYWFQGEIAGNYPLANGNLESHMLRAKAKPNEALTLNLFYYHFMLDHPASLATGVSDDDFGDEINVTADWQATDHLYVIGVLGALIPGDAAEQWVGGNDDWLYTMLYVMYSL